MESAGLLSRLAPQRLQHRLALLLGVMMAAAIGVYATYALREQGTLTARWLDRHALTVAQGMAAASAEALTAQHGAVPESMLLLAETFAGVQALTVVDAGGKALAAVRREPGGRLAAAPLADLTVPADDAASVTRIDAVPASAVTRVAWGPIQHDALRGWVRVELSDPEAQGQSDVARDSIALAVLMVVFATAALLAFLRRPLAALREAADFALALDGSSSRHLSSSCPTLEIAQLRTALDSASRRLYEDRQALVRSEEGYRGVVEGLSELVFQTDASGRWAYLNPAWERISQHAVAHALGRPALEFMPRQDRERNLAVFKPLVTGDCTTLRKVLRYHAKDGSLRWMEVSARALRDESGRFAGLAGSATDVTERHLAQQRLHEQVRFVEQLIETIATPVYIGDRAGRYQGFNKAFARFFGKRRRDFLGKTVFDMFPRELAQWHDQRDRALIAQTGSQDFEAQVMDARGELRDVIYRKATYSNSDGRVAGIVGVITDISERKHFERELVAAKVAAEVANQAKVDFLANVSHEIRTPMNAIIGMTDLTLDTRIDAQQREYLTTVKDSADALLTIINDILDYSRITSGQMEIERIPFSVRDCVAQALQGVEVRARQQGLALRALVADAVPEEVGGDPHRVRQVLLKLLHNAVKFTPAGRVVLSVAVRPGNSDGLALHFAVSDTGIGIAADKQALIFQAFSQADASSTRRHGGTGLGLAICARLVDGMGGRLSVESTPGAGSTFRFSLPLQAAAPNAAEPSAPAPPLQGLRALVVGSGGPGRQHLQRQLAGWGMRVQCAASAAEAQLLSATRTNEPAPLRLIVLDDHTDAADARNDAARLRKLAPDARLVVMTAAGLRGDAARYRKLGASAYLTHPVSAADLLRAVQLALSAAPAAEMITRHSLREKRAAGASVPAPVATRNAFDRKALLDNLGGDLELLHALATTFLDTHGDNLVQLRGALAQDNLDAAYRAAHALKGAAANFGAVAVIDAALAVERAARNADAAQTSAAAARLEARIAELVRALKQEVESAPALA